MVGPGTGIAPFRAFMEQRVFDDKVGTGYFWRPIRKDRVLLQRCNRSWLDNGICTDLPRLGPEIKLRKSMSNTG